jgi:hypothetical protein
LGYLGQKRRIQGHVDNLWVLDSARVTLSHSDVITAHRKVISSHASVTLAHLKPVFSLEKRIRKVLNSIKSLKRRSLSSAKPVDDFFEISYKPGVHYCLKVELKTRFIRFLAILRSTHEFLKLKAYTANHEKTS